MLVLEDLTGLELGAEVGGEGRVERCPRCGRKGVRERVDGERMFVHGRSSELMSDGLLVTADDCCPPERD